MLRLTEPNFEDLIQNHVHCLTTEGRSQKTIDWYSSNLKRFLQRYFTTAISKTLTI